MVNLAVIEQLLNHINSSSLCKITDKILLAVSGGLDSMVMLHLLTAAGFDVAVAHCNFQLRGNESDGDENFVVETCRQFEIPCHVQRFDTEAFARRSAISIQMAARDLRYDFFQALVRKHHYDYIATAHHFDDLIESVLLNLARGTGMDGLRGIADKKENIIRPMMFANRHMIHDYATQQGIQWREDVSNETDDYRRNFMRHQVIPKLKELNPSFSENFRDTHERLLGARSFALQFISDIRSAAVESRSDHSMAIDISVIRQSPFSAVLLWELIKDLGFKFDQCKRITADHQPGKLFFSDTHQLVVDRSRYLLERKKQRNFVTQTIERGQQHAVQEPFGLALREIAQKDFILENSSRIAQLDAALLQYPLTWRSWQSGDYFVPLGMREEKKVSDFLIDLKIPFNAKADVTVLESAGEIVWIVGHRINDRYKVTPATTTIVLIEIRSDDDKKIIS